VIARVLAAMDAAESERIGERISRACLQRAEQGAWHGGPTPPFGYRLLAAGDKRTLAVVPDAAALIHERRPDPGGTKVDRTAASGRDLRRQVVATGLRPTLGKPRLSRYGATSASCRTRLRAVVASAGRRSVRGRTADKRSRGGLPRSGRPPLTCTFVVAGAGFEPATSGL
jgi:hypothetical protein